MEFVTGVTKRDDWCIADLAAAPEHSRGKIRGAVHNIRNMGEISFLILRRYDGLVQCVFEEMNSGFSLRSLKEGATVEAEGISRRESRAPGGTELCLTGLRILSEPVEPMPLPISKWKMNTSLEALLNTRPVSLRNLRERAKFRIQETITRSFRDFLYSQNFTEIHTPKIGARGRGRSEHFPSGLFSSSGSAGTEPSVLQTDDGRRVRPGV